MIIVDPRFWLRPSYFELWSRPGCLGFWSNLVVFGSSHDHTILDIDPTRQSQIPAPTSGPSRTILGSGLEWAIPGSSANRTISVTCPTWQSRVLAWTRWSWVSTSIGLSKVPALTKLSQIPVLTRLSQIPALTELSRAIPGSNSDRVVLGSSRPSDLTFQHRQDNPGYRLLLSNPKLWPQLRNFELWPQLDNPRLRP